MPDAQPLRQAGTIPFRRKNGGFEFCLITSARSGRWGFPKGLIDPGETSAEAALKESYEEAGVRGRLIDDPIGAYPYRKWGTELSVDVWLMEVDQTAKKWPEADVRQRRWATISQALELIDRDDLRHLLQTAHSRLAENHGALPGSSPNDRENGTTTRTP